MKRLLALLLLLPSLAFGSIADEPCHEDGTLLTTGNWEATLEAAVAGTKYRLPAGTLTPTGNIVTIKGYATEANRVTVVPDNCATVVIAGQMRAGGFTTLRGFKVQAATTPGVLTIIPTGGLTTANNTILANMEVSQTATGQTLNAYGLRVGGGVSNLLVTGTKCISTNGGGVCIYLQNNVGTVGAFITDSQFINIDCSNTGGDGCLQTGNVGANTSGAVGGVNNLIDGLWCHDIAYAQCIDLKSMAPGGGTWTIRRVYNDCSNGQEGAGLLVHTGTPPNSIVTIEKSVFNECNNNRAVFLGGKYNQGQLTETNWRVTIKESIFKHNTTGEAIRDELTGTVIERNVFLNGKLLLQATPSSAATTTVRDNVFKGTSITDSRDVTCSNNSLVSTIGGGFSPACSAGRTDDPQWVDTATLDFNSAQTTHVNAGTTNATYNGSARDIGLPDVPIPSSCVVENATPTILAVTWVNNVNAPLSAVTTGLFTARVATVARTINSATVENTNQTHHVLASAVTTGQAVDITCTTIGCVKDSANYGGDALALNGKARVFSQFACTNNVDAAPAAWVASQVAYRITRENNQIAVNAPMSVPPGTALLIEFQTNCTDDDCPPFAQKMRYTKDGGASTALSNTMSPTDNLRFFGNSASSPYIPAEGTHVTACLVATAGNDVTGAVQRTSNAVPNLDLAEDDCAVNAYAIIFDTDAAIGAIYSFCPANEDGTDLNGGCDAPAVVTISDFGGVVAEGRTQATGRTAATGRTQAGARAQVVQ